MYMYIIYIHIYTCMIFTDSWPSEEGERIVSECYSTRYVELLPFLFAFVSLEGGRDLMSQQLCLLHGYAANSKVSTWNQGRWNEQRKYRSKECVNMLIFWKGYHNMKPLELLYRHKVAPSEMWSSWLCDPRSDVECAIGCNEGRTLQEGPGVFEVLFCCSAQRWEKG